VIVPLEIWHARWFARRSSAAGAGESATGAVETAVTEPDEPARTTERGQMSGRGS
jgi:hypothetical protein